MAKKRKKQVQQKQLSEKQYLIKKARSLPIHKCYILPDWKEDGLANILILRKHTNGNLSGAYFYVNLLSEGIKISLFKFNESPEFFDKDIKSDGFEEITYDLAHNIIYGAAAYAEDNGLKNSKEFAITQYMLEEDTDDIPLIDIEFGKNGKPLLLIDENKSNEHKVFALKKTLGEGNFNFVYFDEVDEYFDENLDFLHIEEGEIGAGIEQENLKKILCENYEYYGFENPEIIVEYAKEEGFFNVFAIILESVVEFKEVGFTKFKNLSKLNKLRLVEIMYYYDFQAEDKDFVDFIGSCFFGLFHESEFEIEDELIEDDNDSIEDEELIKELEKIKKKVFNKEKKYKELLEKYPLSESIIFELLEYYYNKNKNKKAFEFIEDLFLNNQENLSLAGQYFTAYLMAKHPSTRNIIKIQNIKIGFPNQKKYNSSNVFLLYSSFLIRAIIDENIPQAESIYNALALLVREDILIDARESIVALKQEEIDKKLKI